MKPKIFVTLFCLLAFTAHAQSWKIEKKETLRQTLKFPNPAAAKAVEVDNVNGSITLVGYDGRELELVAHKTIFARTEEKAQEAREDVKLDISTRNNSIRFYVDGPFRGRDGAVNYKGGRHSGYDVQFNFELKVPRDADFFLKTVNDGEITVTEVLGEYEVENINGGIVMNEVAGAGRVYALNSDVKVTFKKNPTAGSYFGSLNGDVEISFRPELSADLRFKTFNGEVFTDFAVTTLGSAAPSHERHKGKNVYKYDKTYKVRAGSGGPLLDFDAFNGDIRIIKREQ